MYSKNKSGKKPHCINKGKDDVSTITKIKEEHSNIEEKALTLPDVEVIDSGRFTCYSSILSRGVEQPALSEDLDRLQTELEFMLSSVAVQNRLLYSQVDIIAVAEETKPKKPAHLLISKKRKRSDVDKSDPDCKKDHTKLKRKETENSELDDDIKNELLSNRQVIRRSASSAVPTSVIPMASYDTSKKFWEFVDQFCGEIKPKNIKFIEELIKTYDDGKNTNTSEQLNKTAMDVDYDDTIEQQVLPSCSHQYSDGDKLEIEKEEAVKDTTMSDVPDEQFQEDTLVQRLVSLLIEQPQSSTSTSTLSVPTKTGDDDKIDKDGDNGYKKQIKKLAVESSGFTSEYFSAMEEQTELEEAYRKLPLFHTPLCFDFQVRKKLEKVGFIKARDSDDDDLDEISHEIKRCEKELGPLMDQNRNMLNILLNKAKREVIRQNIKSDIKELNGEIADMCLKVASLKKSKKELSPREVNNTWKLLKKREMLQKKLAEM